MPPLLTRLMQRVVLVEDHALTRAGLRAALIEAGFNIVGEAQDGPRGLETVRRLMPDVAVIDLGLPGMDGVELTRQLRESVPQTKIVILTMHDLDTEVLAALAAGADAYCVKSTRTEGIVTAVRVVADGGAYFDPAVAHVVLRRVADPTSQPRPAASPLSPRETEILRLVADGVGNAEIAERLSIGLGTVKGHVRDILEKLSAVDRTQAAVVALRRGII
jgi:two-component system, NarL family, response regulator LiaR